ncbi:Sau3AI family type II restriction endonuclease [Treponema sp.]|uniref:Sau3AI family type II restriction endonuclease n=1 Tax=Treponema sp. TaxID=166 RepID=UPI00298D7C84|nr:Sau3AI family type II restriction endonuclease [Treponema sp.]
MSDLLYNEESIPSIVKYAQRLENKTIDEVIFEQSSYKGVASPTKEYICEGKKTKGGFGQYLENEYFGKEADNKSQPDFPAAKLELKSSPLKTLSNFEVKVKERLVLNHFTFNDLDKEVFDTSHFRLKNENLLLVFYHYNKEREYGKMKVQLADLWQCLKEDEAQIRADWQTIYNKVHDGKAHEISEGDTLYLGACTKGATKDTNWQVQPHSDIKAQGRAFCFKLGYINHIYQILIQRKEHRQILETRILSRNETFIEKVNSIFAPYIGKSAEEICKMRNENYNPADRSRYANISRRIMGFNKNLTNLYEFNAADIQFKTIRVEPNGKCKESMSFKNVNYCEIVEEEWEDSYFYNAITSKFIIVLFKRDEGQEEYYLDKVIDWQVPVEDYHFFEGVWTDTKNKVAAGDYEHFMKISDNPASHIRPKGKNNDDLMYTPQGIMEKKKCFWINQSYIQEKILNSIYKK